MRDISHKKKIHDINKKSDLKPIKNKLSPHNIYLKHKSPNLILKYEKLYKSKELKKSLQNTINHNILTTPSKVKILSYNDKSRKSNSLYKNTPKYLLSCLENNVLIGKISQKRTYILPKIFNNKSILNIRTNNKYNELESKNSKNRIMLYASSSNFNPQKNSIKNNNLYNLYKEINLIKSNEELCKNESLYTYVIRPENCGYLIRNCFKHRKNWKEIENLDYKYYNFRWQQNTRGIDYNSLSLSGKKKQMVNHFEFLGVIANKANLFINMMQYAESQDKNVFKYLPFTVLFDYNKINFFNKLIRFEYLFKNIENYIVSYYEIDERKYKKDKDKIYGLFFPFIDRIGNKTVINIPDTHYIKKSININNIINNNDNNENKISSKIKNNFWIIKAPDLNRGRCIKIVNNMMLIKRSIREYSMGIKIGYNDKSNNDENFNDFSDYNDINDNYNYNYKNRYEDYDEEEENKDYYNNIHYNSTHKSLKNNYESASSSPTKDNNYNNYRSHIIVIQKYIEKPLLYYGRKFDIRIWVLLTQNLNVYMFEEGHLKCCSINYNLNSDNTFCHLTNYSFQKYNSNFGKYEFGNEVSFLDFQKNIDTNYDKKINFKNDIIPKIKEIIKFTFESVKNKINPMQRKYTFEIFGFDFMLDCNFEPFLIEVNSNPGLEESSPLIKMLVPRMLDDALRLTVDKEFGTIYNFEGNEKHSFDNIIPYKSPFHVDGYSDVDNMFRFICDLNECDDSYFDNYRNNVINSKFFFKIRNCNKHI